MAGKTNPPWAHTELRPDSETRDLALVSGDLSHAAARTNYELRYINENLMPSAEIWPADSLQKQMLEFPMPQCEPPLAQLKADFQRMALDENLPTFTRVLALSNFLSLTDNSRCWFDLVEKAKAMLHELKFKIQGQDDWNKVRWTQQNLEERLAEKGTSIDHVSTQPAFQNQIHRLPRFIQHSFLQWQQSTGWDEDLEFAESFGIKTSTASHREAEPNTESEIVINGNSNGHVNYDDESMGEDELDGAEYDMDEDDADEDHGSEDEGLDEDDNDDDSSDLEEISAEVFRASEEHSREHSETLFENHGTTLVVSVGENAAQTSDHTNRITTVDGVHRKVEEDYGDAFNYNANESYMEPERFGVTERTDGNGFNSNPSESPANNPSDEHVDEVYLSDSDELQIMEERRLDEELEDEEEDEVLGDEEAEDEDLSEDEEITDEDEESADDEQ